jgi:glycosyltransferase involved in cell wall biosynthesis
MNSLAPICLFTYNRLNETQQTVEALKRNYLALESELFVFSDGPKDELSRVKVEAVRQYLHTVTGFKSVVVIEANNNKGLANSIITGVSEIIEKYDKIIVLEDDLISSPNFLDFMNQALEFYRNDQTIQSVSGYSLALKDKTNEVYFQIRPGSWGWATWKNRWIPELFDKEKLKIKIHKNPSILKELKRNCGNDIPHMLIKSINGQNDSWYVRWTVDHFTNKHYAVFPTYSFIENIGHHADATHCKGINTYVSDFVDEQTRHFNFPIFQIPAQHMTQAFLRYFSRQYKIAFRIKLLKTRDGRKQLVEEIKSRIGHT